MQFYDALWHLLDGFACWKETWPITVFIDFFNFSGQKAPTPFKRWFRHIRQNTFPMFVYSMPYQIMGKKGLDGRVLLGQPSKNLPITTYIFFQYRCILLTYVHKISKSWDIFCFICLNKFLTDVHPVEPGNTVVSAYVGRRGKSVPGASNIAQWNRNWNFVRKVQSLFTHH